MTFFLTYGIPKLWCTLYNVLCIHVNKWSNNNLTMNNTFLKIDMLINISGVYNATKHLKKKQLNKLNYLDQFNFNRKSHLYI